MRRTADDRPAPPPPAPRGRPLALVADDEPLFLDFMTRALARAGLDILPAPDGRRAVDLFRARHPEIDLVILDIAMPGLDGLSAWREMKAIRDDLRAILVSGCVPEPDRPVVSDLAAAGAFRFLAKPFGLAALREAVKETMK